MSFMKYSGIKGFHIQPNTKSHLWRIIVHMGYPMIKKWIALCLTQQFSKLAMCLFLAYLLPSLLWIEERSGREEASWQAAFFRLPCQLAFWPWLRLWWETGGQKARKGQGILPALIHLELQWSLLQQQCFFHRKNRQTDSQWFQVLLGSFRSILFFCTKSSKDFLLLLIYEWVVLQVVGPGGFLKVSSILHARTHETCSLSL